MVRCSFTTMGMGPGIHTEFEATLTRHDLMPLILEALEGCGGTATIVEISRSIWDRYKHDLEASGDFFYVWQYELRWAGEMLAKQGRILRGQPGRRWHIVP